MRSEPAVRRGTEAEPSRPAAPSELSLGTFVSFRYRAFRFWFTGQSISQTGFWFYVVTQSLLVLQLTNSGTMVGVVAAVQNVPLFLIAPYAGVLTDRVDTRRLIITTQSITTLSSLVLGVLVLLGVGSIAWVLVFAAITGVAWAFDQPARRTFAADLVPDQAVTNALSLNGVLLQLARMVGPALAALVIDSFGFGWGFVATGMCTSMSVLALVLMGSAGRAAQVRAPGSGGTMRAGFGVVWRDQYLRTVLLMLFVTSTLAFNWNVLFPIFAVRDLQGTSATFALLMGAMAAGSIGGALWLARRAGVGGVLLASGACLYGVGQMGMAATPSVVLATLTAVVLGLGSTVLVNGGAASLQLRVDRGMRGRVMGLFTLAVLGGVGLGAPISGFLAEVLGTRVALGAGGAAALLSGLVSLWMLRPRRYEA